MKRPLHSLATGLCLWLLCSLSHANDWYQVEILVLERPASPTAEAFGGPLQPGFHRSALLTPGAEPELPEQQQSANDLNAIRNGAWRFLSQEQNVLITTRQNLEKSGYKTLLHTSWKQPVRTRGQALPLYLEGGADIPLASVASPETDVLLKTVPDVPRTSRAFQGSLLLHSLDRYVEVEPDFWFRKAGRDGEHFWTFINQKRRLRNDEVNYFDHPLFAVLLRVSRQ